MSASVIDVVDAPVPRRYFGWRMVLALLLFWPFGLAVGFFGWRSLQAVSAGEREAAVHAARVARRWFVAAIVVGVVVDVLIMAVLLLLGAFPSG